MLNGGTQFMKEYLALNASGENKLSTNARQKLQPVAAGDEMALSVLSILKPLYDLTLFLQKDECSLADALIEVFRVIDELDQPFLRMVDEKGDYTKSKKSVGALKDCLVDFRMKLRTSLVCRLIIDIEDLSLISVALE